MRHFSYDVMCLCIDMNYVMLLVSYFLKEKKKKKFAPVNRVVAMTKRVVTYGIRAGSTRDLGFTTDDLNTVGVLGVLHLICVFLSLGRLGLCFKRV
jgi:hypothetical protein